LNALLKNPYYKGVVGYCGVAYEGAHDALVSADLWERVQEVLAAHNQAGEKQRRHNHYLKSTLYCGRCGSRMIVSRSRSHTGRVYPYFTCVGKHQKRTGCTMRAVPIDLVEELVEDYYATIQLPNEIQETLEPHLRSDLDAYYAEARSEQAFLATRRTRLLNERSKLLQAHYAGAVPLDLLKSEQSRIAGELDAIVRRTKQTEDHQALVEENVRRALALASDCQAAYRSAPPSIRRLFNQFFFAKLFVDDETLRGELSPAFAALLAEGAVQLRPRAVPRPAITPGRPSGKTATPRVSGSQV
jgi:hypothetical protein